MKKKWFWIGLVLVLVLFLIGYLYSIGVIKTSWQWLSVILMALAAPSQLLINLLGGKNKKVEKILLAQKGRIQAEQTHRIAYDQVIKQKEQHIQELKAKIAQMEDKVDSLELQQKTIEKTVNKTSDIDQLSDEFLQAYGDED